MSETVTVIDQITLPQEHAEEWLSRWRADYIPAARTRGMRVVRQWRCFSAADAVSVVVLWEVPGIYEFYGMRASATADPQVSRFWQWTDTLAVARERRVLEELPQ